MSQTDDQLTAGMRADLQRLAGMLLERRHGVALTGAGISVESGIPDFRSPGGLWERFDPMDYATIDAFLADPGRVWEMLGSLDGLLRDARPNPAHTALARLERAGVLDGVVTQNVDNLHQRAGSRRVVEFHGNGSKLRCLECGRVEDSERLAELGMPPRCRCGTVLKPDVVFFGEPIPPRAMEQARDLARGCEVMLVAGTSATVAPASMIPLVARDRGAVLAEFNLEPTALNWACEASFQVSASISLTALADLVEATATS